LLVIATSSKFSVP